MCGQCLPCVFCKFITRLGDMKINPDNITSTAANFNIVDHADTECFMEQSLLKNINKTFHGYWFVTAEGHAFNAA